MDIFENQISKIFLKRILTKSLFLLMDCICFSNCSYFSSSNRIPNKTLAFLRRSFGLWIDMLKTLHHTHDIYFISQQNRLINLKQTESNSNFKWYLSFRTIYNLLKKNSGLILFNSFTFPDRQTPGQQPFPIPSWQWQVVCVWVPHLCEQCHRCLPHIEL